MEESSSVSTATKYTDSPYRRIPKELLLEYTANGKMKLYDMWFDESNKPVVEWTKDYVDEYIQRFTPDNVRKDLQGKTTYGNPCCVWLLDSFEKYDIRDKRVAVVGSLHPWIEAMLINMGNKVTTIEYNVHETHYGDTLSCKDYFEYFENFQDEPFDAIVTYSSVEHSGLGRYGDPLDPNGDLKTMEVIYNNMKPGGILVWGAPVGQDMLVWNSHRIYGEHRLSLIFEKFSIVDYFGPYNLDTLIKDMPVSKESFLQPVIVAKKP